MKINLQERKPAADKGFMPRAEKKLTKLDRYFARDSEATVKLDKEKGAYIVEITVSGGSLFFRAQERSENSYAALDAAVDALDRQIRKHRTKLGKRIRENAFSAPETEPLPEEDALRIVRTKRFRVLPMTREEAVLQMEMLGHNFFAFRNAEDGDRICIVYARTDGDYGLIEVE